MAYKKIVEVEKTENEEEIEIKEPEIIEPKVERQENKTKPKVIKKGSKITISGRCFGSSNLECPLGAVRNYSTKILDIENGNYLIDKGWISPKGLKD